MIALEANTAINTESDLLKFSTSSTNSLPVAVSASEPTFNLLGESDDSDNESQMTPEEVNREDIKKRPREEANSVVSTALDNAVSVDLTAPASVSESVVDDEPRRKKHKKKKHKKEHRRE